jgi:ElaB/YqjD/DUF883 family membrane-anchored ribosome-binding protein
MVDKDMTEAAQNAAASARQAADAAKDYAGKGVDAAREYAGAAHDYANKGYDAAREYANAGIDVAGRMSENLTEFVRNEPWIAMAAAFAVGYVAARLMRRLSI